MKTPEGWDPKEWAALSPEARGKAMNEMGLLKGSMFHPDAQKKTTRVRILSRNARGCVVIMRPSPWGNPFVIGEDGNREEVIAKFRDYLTRKPKLVERARQELKGKVLGCFCSVSEPCHGDVWIEFIDRDPINDTIPFKAEMAEESRQQREWRDGHESQT